VLLGRGGGEVGGRRLPTRDVIFREPGPKGKFLWGREKEKKIGSYERRLWTAMVKRTLKKTYSGGINRKESWWPILLTRNPSSERTETLYAAKEESAGGGQPFCFVKS